MDTPTDQALERLLKRLSINENAPSSTPDSMNLSLTTGLDNDESKQKIEFLSYQTETLEDKNTELTDENKRLRVLLRTRESDIFKLKNSLDELKNATGGGGLGSEKAVQRIVDLSKKNRELTSQLEVEKSTIKRLNTKLENLNNQEVQRKLKSAVKARKQECETPRDDTEKQLKDRINALNLKQTESNHQISALQQEKNLLTKLLQREVGEGTTVQNILANPSSWKGRSEQIAMLQTKVTSLKGEGESPSRLERKRQKDIKVLENNRKQQLQDLKSEKERIEVELTQSKKNYDAVKARNNTLSSDLKTVKAQLNALINKGRTDDELINRLLNEKDAVDNKKEPNLDDIWRREDEIERLKNLTSDKEKRIRQLEEEITTLREKQVRPDSLQGLSRSGPTYLGGTDSDANIDYLLRATEVEKDRLFELTEVLNTRLTQSEEKAIQNDAQFKKLSRQNAQLEKLVENLKTKRLPRCDACNTTAKLRHPNDSVTQLDILQDEVDVLKSHISALQSERQNDLSKYKEMLSSSRQIFLTGLKELQEKK